MAGSPNLLRRGDVFHFRRAVPLGTIDELTGHATPGETARYSQGTRSWLFRYSRNDTNQWMGLGSVEEKSFTEARDEAAMLRVLVKRGEDPIAQRREVGAKRQIEQKPQTPTFDECAKKYIASHESGWKNPKHIAQWKSTLKTYASPVLGKRRVDEITVEDVLKVLKPLWTSKPETASRLRGRIEKVLGWATAMKYRSGENPPPGRARYSTSCRRLHRSRRSSTTRPSLTRKCRR